MKRFKIHTKSDHPTQVEGEQFSVNVITCDKNGLINLGFYNYDSDSWDFLSDTLSDYTEGDFVWIYPPMKKMRQALISAK